MRRPTVCCPRVRPNQPPGHRYKTPPPSSAAQGCTRRAPPDTLYLMTRLEERWDIDTRREYLLSPVEEIILYFGTPWQSPLGSSRAEEWLVRQEDSTSRSRSDVERTVHMANSDKKKCKHIPCTCEVPSGQEYCGQRCKEAGEEDVEIACDCGHNPFCPLIA